MSDRVRRGWVRASLLLCCLAFTTTGWDSCDGNKCTTKADFGVVVGAQQISTLPLRELPKVVWICPGTFVTLGWSASNDVKSGEITGIGQVKVPTSYQTRPVDKTTTFTITAHGDCDAKASVTVNVFQPGVTNEISVPLVNKKLPLWETNLSEYVWDPHIVVEEIRFSGFAEQGWHNVKLIDVAKTDLDGTGHSFVVDTSFARPWPASTDLRITGDWKVTIPVGMATSTDEVPQDVTLQMKTDCKPL